MPCDKYKINWLSLSRVVKFQFVWFEQQLKTAADSYPAVAKKNKYNPWIFYLAEYQVLIQLVNFKLDLI